MSLVLIIILFLAISTSVYSAALLSNTEKCLDQSHVFKAIVGIASMQSIMLGLGYLLADQFAHLIKDLSIYVIAIIWILIGFKKMIGAAKTKKAAVGLNLSIGSVVFWTSIALGIDTFIIGLSFAFFESNLYLNLIILLVISGLMVVSGIAVGKKTGKYKSAFRLEFLGGMSIIVLGIIYLFIA